MVAYSDLLGIQAFLFRWEFLAIIVEKMGFVLRIRGFCPMNSRTL